MEKHIEVIGIDHGWSNMKTEKENRENRGCCYSHRSRSRRDRVQGKTLGINKRNYKWND